MRPAYIFSIVTMVDISKKTKSTGSNSSKEENIKNMPHIFLQTP